MLQKVWQNWVHVRLLQEAALPAGVPGAQPTTTQAPAADLLGLDDLLGGASLGPADGTPAAPPPLRLQLAPSPQLTPQVFQQKWGSLTNQARLQQPLSQAGLAFVQQNRHQVSWKVSHWLASHR